MDIAEVYRLAHTMTVEDTIEVIHVPGRVLHRYSDGSWEAQDWNEWVSVSDAERRQLESAYKIAKGFLKGE